MLVKVGIRLEIQVVQLQIMEKQIFKSCTFTFSGLKIRNSIFGQAMVVKLLDSLVHGCYSGSYFVSAAISLKG